MRSPSELLGDEYFNHLSQLAPMPVFTHYWVTGFGWENTIYCPEDFQEWEEIGDNAEGIIFLAVNERGGRHILKGCYQ